MQYDSIPYQSRPPFKKLSPRKAYRVDPSEIHPFIRIAHQVTGPIQIPQRIIFDYEIVLFVAGRGCVKTHAQSVDFQANHLFIFHPFIPHEIQMDDAQPCEHFAVHFDLIPDVPPPDDQLDERQPYEVRLTQGLTWPEHLSLPPAHTIKDSLRRVIRAHASTEPTAKLLASTYLSQALIEMFKLHDPSPRTPMQGSTEAACRIKLERAIQHVQKNLASDITVEDLAGAAGISASSLTRIFKHRMGTTPMHYLRQTRVERARQLLGDIDLTVQQVGNQVGLSDPYHFSKVFRRIDGLSPSAFRNMLLAGRTI